MTFHKLSSLTRTAPVLPLLLIVAAILFAGPLAMAQQTATTATATQRQAIQDTQALSTQFVSEDQKIVNGIKFTPRWGIVDIVNANSLGILFADCNQFEFAVSGTLILQAGDMRILESYPIGLPNNFMSWILVVSNDDQTEGRLASAGVICAADSGQAEGRTLSNTLKLTIHNTVKQFIKVENKQIINIKQLINIYQNLTQIANQYVNITGNNNTVTQIINQSASQIAATNGTNISQIINQTASQQGIISAPPTTNETEGVIPEDTTPPVITVPDDITEEATGPDGATVSFEVSAVDDVDGPVDASCDHNSGEIFPIGETVVTCTAEDFAGNAAEESFTIIVEEPPAEEPPAEEPPANETEEE
jgi:HYR domain